MTVWLIGYGLEEKAFYVFKFTPWDHAKTLCEGVDRFLEKERMVACLKNGHLISPGAFVVEVHGDYNDHTVPENFSHIEEAILNIGAP